MIIKKDTCEQAWQELLKTIPKEADQVINSKGKYLYEVLGCIIKVKNPSDYEKPLLRMTKKMDFIYPKIEELESIAMGKVAKTNFAQRMFNYDNMDQIADYVIPLLKQRPQTKRAITINYNPLLDSNQQAKAVISILSFYFKLNEGKLHTIVIMRSLDCFLGLPANFIHAGSIQKHVAEQLNVNVGSLTFMAANAHLHKDHERFLAKIE